jgi:hypothetical protein
MTNLLTKKDLVDKIYLTHIIIDSCVWLEFYQYYNSTKSFRELFTYLNINKCQILTLPVIKFEVLRSQTLDNYNQLNTLIDKLSKVPITSTAQKHPVITEKALDIARIYKKNNNTNVSFIDCYMIATIESIKSTTFILTENHKDFTSLLFDPVYIHPIPIQNKNGALKIYTPCIYEFSRYKYKNELQKLSK